MRPEIIRKLQEIMGKDGVVADETELLVYECDALALFKHRPDAVVFAQNAKQVSDVVKLANEHSIPFLPRGSGTGLSGGGRSRVSINAPVTLATTSLPATRG